MLHLIGPARSRPVPRHRLGTPGLVHCLAHPEVELALAVHRRSWLSTLLTPARHRWTDSRLRAITHQPAWSPTG